MILLDPDARPVIAHRGASGEHAENTLPAFDAALEQGADAIEFDVRLAADGVPVVIHDATVDRTTGASGAVSGFAAGELADLDAGGGAGVPTLDGVLTRYPDTPCIIEIKEVRAARPAAAVMQRHGAVGRVLVGSFEHAALAPFSSPPFARSASRRETALCWTASRVGVRWPARAVRAFTVPERHGRLTVVDRRFVRAARRRGRPVHVWTVDEPQAARRLRALGVAGIITNYPAVMVAAF